MYRFLIAIISFMLSSVTMASGYTGAAKIERISSMGSSGQFEIWGDWTNVDGCTNSSKWIVGEHSTDTEQTQNSKLSVALATHLSDKTIELYVDGCNSSNQPIVKGLYLPSRN